MTTTVLITGSNKGLGRATARELAGRGWTILLGSRDVHRGTETAAAIAADLAAADGGRGPADVEVVQLDVTDDSSVDAAVDQVAARTDHLDVLINNAGVIGGRQGPLETRPQDFLACFGVNLLGPVRVTRAFLPLLERAQVPRIVMVSSGMGSLSVTTDPDRLESTIASLVYPSSKAALNMVTAQYAKVLPGWKVNAVDPGYTATDLNAHSGTKTVEEGARPIVAAACLGPDGPTGAFLGEEGDIAW